jgi:hypothetical protein
VARRICGREETCERSLLSCQRLIVYSYYPNPPKQAVPSVVEDVTGRESQFTLWKNGFMYAKQHTNVMLKTEDLADNEKILKEYYPEMEQWLKDV